MRILLVQHALTNGAGSFPIGLGCIAGVLLKDGHEVDFIDLALENAGREVLSRRIRNFQPEAMGFTLWTTNYTEFIKLMGECPEVTGIPVVAGGPHACADSENVLRDGFVDVVVRCEGELIVDELFSVIGTNGDLSKVKGIAFLDKAEKYTETAEAGVVADLDAYPSPPYDLMRVNDYCGKLKGRPSVELMMSRGCPFSCIFCYRGPTGGHNTRRLSTDRFFEEIRTLNERYGFRSFFFVDDTFTLKRSWIEDLCHRFIASGIKPAWACQTRVDCVDYDLLKLMKQAGCVCIHLGVESGNAEIMDKLVKKLNKEDVRKTFSDCQRLHIATIAYFMFGSPWETKQTVRESIDFAKELKSTITLFFAATPYPGSPMRQIYIDKNLPVPRTCDEYGRFWVEDAPPDGEENIRRAGNFDTNQLCLDATREIVRTQVLDIRSYPRLFSEFVNQYGLREFARRSVKRLRL